MTSFAILRKNRHFSRAGVGELIALRVMRGAVCLARYTGRDEVQYAEGRR